MADDRTAQAVDTVARHLIVSAVQTADVREEYTDIGEVDWSAVVDRVDQLAERMLPGHDDYDAAYEYLAERAGGATP